MSAQSLAGASAGIPADELAVVQRVQQLQALIESARQAASPRPRVGGRHGLLRPQTANADFASALQAATSADAAGVAGTQPAGLGTHRPSRAPPGAANRAANTNR